MIICHIYALYPITHLKKIQSNKTTKTSKGSNDYSQDSLQLAGSFLLEFSVFQSLMNWDKQVITNSAF